MMRVLYHRWFYAYLAGVSLIAGAVNLGAMCCQYISPEWVAALLFLLQTVAGILSLLLFVNLSSQKWRNSSGNDPDSRR